MSVESQLEKIKLNQEHHNESDDVRFDSLGKESKEIKEEIKDIKGSIKTIKENHLHHIEKDITALKTDMGWVKKITWLVVSTSLGGLIVGIINLVFK